MIAKLDQTELLLALINAFEPLWYLNGTPWVRSPSKTLGTLRQAPNVTSPRIAAAAAVLAATAGACVPEPDELGIARLMPTASSEAPLSDNTDVALVTQSVACVVDSYDYQIRCSDRRGLVLGAFGREGAGPGEFRRPAVVERGPDETVAVVDVELARLTLFEPSGAYISDTKIPSGFTGHKLSEGRLFGADFVTFYESNPREAQSTSVLPRSMWYPEKWYGSDPVWATWWKPSAGRLAWDGRVPAADMSSGRATANWYSSTTGTP